METMVPESETSSWHPDAVVQGTNMNARDIGSGHIDPRSQDRYVVHLDRFCAALQVGAQQISNPRGNDHAGNGGHERELWPIGRGTNGCARSILAIVPGRRPGRRSESEPGSGGRMLNEAGIGFRGLDSRARLLRRSRGDPAATTWPSSAWAWTTWPGTCTRNTAR